MIRIRNLDGNIIYYNADDEIQFGGGLDIQKALLPFGELHLRTFPKMKKYQYCGPGTDLKTRIKRGDRGINRLDKVCKQHDIDYYNILLIKK